MSGSQSFPSPFLAALMQQQQAQQQKQQQGYSQVAPTPAQIQQQTNPTMGQGPMAPATGAVPGPLAMPATMQGQMTAPNLAVPSNGAAPLSPQMQLATPTMSAKPFGGAPRSFGAGGAPGMNKAGIQGSFGGGGGSNKQQFAPNSLANLAPSSMGGASTSTSILTPQMINSIRQAFGAMT